MKIKYRNIRMSPANKIKLEVINNIVEEYQAQGYILTLRQLYYQLVSRDVVPNNQKEYSKLSTLLKEGRMAGIVDWDAIEDRLRKPSKPSSFNSPKDILEAAIQQYALPRQDGQRTYVETWCFPADTNIICKDGVFPIQVIQKGDKVLTEDGTYQKVTNIMCRVYTGTCYNIKAVGQLPIMSTKNHPWSVVAKDVSYKGKGIDKKFFKRTFLPVQNIKNQDMLVIPRIHKVVIPVPTKCYAKTNGKNIEIIYDTVLYAFIGIYLAEGRIRECGRTVQLTVCSSETLQIDLIQMFADSMGIKTHKVIDDNATQMYLYSIALCRWLESNFSTGSFCKKLPGWFITAPLEDQIKCFKWYMLGDGHWKDITRNGIYVGSRSKVLIQQWQIVLVRNGYGACITEVIDHALPMYRIEISGQFAEDLSKKLQIDLPFVKRRYNHVRIDKDFAYYPVKKVEQVTFSGTVYNLNVAKRNTYCTPLLVHNCEKDSLSSVLKRVTEQYHVPIMVNRGYSSVSAMFDSYQRFKKAYESDQAIKVLYLGDFDPSGIDMIRDIRDRIYEFIEGEYGFELDKPLEEFEFSVTPIALTREQIDQYDPPPNPAKVTDPRAKDFIEKHGRTSWEVDALRPEVLNELLNDAILEHINVDTYKAILMKEKKDIKKLKSLEQYL